MSVSMPSMLWAGAQAVHTPAPNSIPMVAITLMTPSNGDVQSVAMTLEDSKKAVFDLLQTLTESNDEWSRNALQLLSEIKDTTK